MEGDLYGGFLALCQVCGLIEEMGIPTCQELSDHIVN